MSATQLRLVVVCREFQLSPIVFPDEVAAGAGLGIGDRWLRAEGRRRGVAGVGKEETAPARLPPKWLARQVEAEELKYARQDNGRRITVWRHSPAPM